MRRAAGGHRLGDVEAAFGRQAEPAAGVEVIEERVGGGFRRLVDVEADIETGMRIAALAGAEGEVVMQRVDAGFEHVRVLQQVPLGGEEGVGIAAFVGAPVPVMMQRLDIGGADVRIGAAIVVAVEIARLGILRGGFGLRCQSRLRNERLVWTYPTRPIRLILNVFKTKMLRIAPSF